MEPATQSVFEQEQRPIYYASTGQRFANYIIDLIGGYVFVFITSFIIVFFWAIISPDTIYMVAEKSPTLSLLQSLTALILFILYYVLLEGIFKGKTLGKLITGTRAVKDEGGQITWGDAFKRSLCRAIPFEPFSAFGGNPWHDSITHTTVIKER